MLNPYTRGSSLEFIMPEMDPAAQPPTVKQDPMARPK